MHKPVTMTARARWLQRMLAHSFLQVRGPAACPPGEPEWRARWPVRLARERQGRGKRREEAAAQRQATGKPVLVGRAAVLKQVWPERGEVCLVGGLSGSRDGRQGGEAAQAAARRPSIRQQVTRVS